VKGTAYGGTSYPVPSPKITREIRSRWARNRRDASTVLGKKPEGKCQLGRYRYKWEDNSKSHLEYDGKEWLERN
jgi:hypothetical protein